MAYFLKHYFDPRIEQTRLAPKQSKNGSVDHYDLGYVQYVTAGQIVAEWIAVDAEQKSTGEQKHFFDQPIELVGEHCQLHPDNPLCIVAQKAGHVCYHNGRITVCSTLKIPHSVDYRTGNISFQGLIEIQGGVRSGFTVQGQDVWIQETVDGACIEARHTICCQSGLKGCGKALLKAGTSLELDFCEQARICAGDRLHIAGACLHSEVYSGNALTVSGRVTGSRLHSLEHVFIGGQFGGGMGTQTAVIVGYDSTLLFEDRCCEVEIERVRAQIHELQQMCSEEQHDKKIGLALKESSKHLEELFAQRARIWQGDNTGNLLGRVEVKGKVLPGVEISIGSLWYRVNEFMEDVHFYVEDMEMKIGSPAHRK